MLQGKLPLIFGSLDDLSQELGFGEWAQRCWEGPLKQ